MRQTQPRNPVGPDDASSRAAAGALADLFFAPPNPLEAQSVNELRHKYRDWRQAVGTVPHADVLDLNREAKTDEQRASGKMRRVKTVGARLHHSPVHRRPECTRALMMASSACAHLLSIQQPWPRP